MARCAAGPRCIRSRRSWSEWSTGSSRCDRTPDRADLVGLVARAPLDAAADARHLVLGHRSAPERRVDRGAQIRAGHRSSVAGPAVVELTAVDETPISVEEEEVGRARGVVGPRDLLR